MNLFTKTFTYCCRAYSTTSKFPSHVRIVEVGARDGLQNEINIVSTNVKLQLIKKLEDAGLKTIEVASFVSPKWVPQMADHDLIVKQLTWRKDVSYPVLVPNLKGLEAALNVGVKEIAVFSAASEAFTKKNTNCTISESLQRVEEIVSAAHEHNIKIRGYVSCVIGCPYQGPIAPHKVTELAKILSGFGCYEISLGDTIGVGTPGSTAAMLEDVLKHVPSHRLALHCHDTYGQALANVLVGLEFGIRVIDSSVAGLGGCPYADGATGNLSTEDLIYMLHGMNIETGVDLNEVIKVGHWICDIIGKKNNSRVGNALKKKLFIEKQIT